MVDFVREGFIVISSKKGLIKETAKRFDPFMAIVPIIWTECFVHLYIAHLMSKQKESKLVF